MCRAVKVQLVWLGFTHFFVSRTMVIPAGFCITPEIFLETERIATSSFRAPLKIFEKASEMINLHNKDDFFDFSTDFQRFCHEIFPVKPAQK